MRSITRVVSAFLLVVSILPLRAMAAQKTWTGAADASWSNGANWSDGTAPVPGDDLVFPPVASVVMNSDFAPGTRFGSLSFTGSGYSVTGNSIMLDAGINDSGSGANLINIGLQLTGNQTFTLVNDTVGGIVLDRYALTVAGVGTSTFKEPIYQYAAGGALNLISGRLVLSANSSYAGPTTVTASTLIVQGSITSAVNVSQAGILTGNGSTGPVTIGSGSFAPADYPAPGAGQFSTGDLSLSSNTGCAIDLGTPIFDEVVVTGTVSLGDALLDLRISANANLSSGQTFMIVANDGTDPVSGTFKGLPEGAMVTVAPYTFRISYRGGDGNDVVLTNVTAATPTVSSMSPTSGPLTGGTVVTIAGSNLSSFNTVDFGGTPALPSSNDGNTITVTTPSRAAAGAVTVTLLSGTASLVVPGQFTYTTTAPLPTAPPTITSILPNHGPAAGGTLITISGANLGGASVTFGAIPVNVLTNDGSTLTFDSLAGVAGTSASVSVTTTLGAAQTSFAFDAASAPVGIALSPQSQTVTVMPGGVTLTAALSSAQSSDTIVTLISSNPAAVPVPATITISAGQIGATFHANSFALGDATITATLPPVLGGAAATATVHVVGQLLSFTPSDQTIAIGTPATVRATLGAAQATDTVVNLTLMPGAPSAVVPPSITIPAGATTQSFTISDSAAENVSVNGMTTIAGAPASASANVHFLAPAAGPIGLTPATQTVAVMPGAVQLTIALNSPQPSDTIVSLASSDVTVVGIPPSVTIPAGQIGIAVHGNSFKGGSAVVTATLPSYLGSSSATATVNVVGQLLTFTPQDQTIAIGTPATVTAVVGAAQPTSTLVTLTTMPGAPSAVVPPSVMIPAGATTQPFTISDFAAENVSVNGMATIAGAPATASASVHFLAPAAGPIVLTPALQTIQVMPGGVTLTIALNSAQPADTLIMLVSSNPAAVGVPASATIPAGQIGVTVRGNSYAVGTSTITATLPAALGSASATAEVDVVGQLLQLAPSDQTIAAGTPATVTVTLGQAQPTPTTVMLTKMPGAQYASVPASVIIPPGATSGVFTVSDSAPESVRINGTATLAGTTASATASVQFILPAGVAILIAPATQTINVGPPGSSFTVYLASPSPTGTIVTISSSNPAVLFPPSNLTIPASMTSASMPITAMSAGTATITATLPNNSGSASTTVTAVAPAASITLPVAPTTVSPGSTTLITITISPVQSSATTITLQSASPANVTVPATVTIPAGSSSATFQATGVAAPGATIIATLPASLGGGTASTLVNVSSIAPPPATIQLSPNPLSMPVGTATGQITVTISPMQPVQTSIAVNANGAASVPPAFVVNIPANTPSATFSISGLYAGTGQVLASLPFSLGSSGATANVTVTSTPGPLTIGMSPSGVILSPGGMSMMNVGISSPQAAAITIQLSSSNPASVTVTPSVTIAAGATSTTFQVNGVSAPGATITATLPAALGGASTSVNVSVTSPPPPPLTISLSPSPASVTAGSSTTMTVTITPPQPTLTTVTLSSANPAMVAVPASISVPAGMTTGTFQATGIAAPGATITAMALGLSAMATVNVSAPPPGLRGDSNGDGAITAADIYYRDNYLLSTGPPPVNNSDDNNDGFFDGADVFYLIHHLFSGGPAPGGSMLPASGSGADVLSIGSSISAGTQVVLPLYLRDVAGTNLGVDQVAGRRIQAFIVKFNYAPAAAVSSVAIVPAGALSTLTETFTHTVFGSGFASLVASFAEASAPIALTSNAAAPGDLIANVIFTLSPTAIQGTTIQVNFDGAATILSNDAGTLKENQANGSLILNNGTITVGRPQKTWTGSVDGRWSTGGNWSDGYAPVGGEDLVFPAIAANRSMNSDFAPGMRFHSIAFTGGGYSVAGNSITLDAGITDSGSGSNLLNVSVQLGQAQTFTLVNDTLGGIVLDRYPLTVNGSGVNTIKDPIIQYFPGGGLTLTAGTLVLTANNNYSGPTNVVGGALVVNGSIAPSPVTVSGPGMIGGSGTIGALGITGGTVAAGDQAGLPPAALRSAPGILHTGGISAGTGSAFRFDLNGATAGSGYDQIAVNGGVVLSNSSLLLYPGPGFATAAGDTYTIISNDGTDPVVGTFIGLPEGTSINLGGHQLRISYAGGDGNDVTLTPACNPTATITTNGPTTFCAGGSVILTANAGASYQWSNGATTQSITVSSSGTFSVNVTDVSGCAATSTQVTVTVNPLPSPTITQTVNGSVVTLTASPGTTYAWSTGETTQSIDVTAAGSYTVTETNAAGCSAQSAPSIVSATATGTNVSVTDGYVSATFSGVTGSGVTSVTPIAPSTAGSLPGGYEIGGIGAYEISTTAQYTSPIVVAIQLTPQQLAGMDLATFNSLRILHNEGGVLVDRTILPPDSPAPVFSTGTIYARVNSLSPFLVALSDSPTLGAIAGPAAPVLVHSPISVTATFSDRNHNAHAGTWNWGDGTLSQATITQSGGVGTVSDVHVYANAGIYRVTLTVTNNGAYAAHESFSYVVVYDPNAGFVTGGGFVKASAGSFALDPSLAGKTTFAAQWKYAAVATAPTGQITLSIDGTAWQFQSTAATWLVISGSKAQIRGSGAFRNGAPGTAIDCEFVATEVDGKLSSPVGSDAFRIRIWNRATGALMYDNVRAAGDDLLNPQPQPIGGGSIDIHH